MEPPDQLSGLVELSAKIFFLSSVGTTLIELLQLIWNTHDPLFCGRQIKNCWTGHWSLTVTKSRWLGKNIIGLTYHDTSTPSSLSLSQLVIQGILEPEMISLYLETVTGFPLCWFAQTFLEPIEATVLPLFSWLGGPEEQRLHSCSCMCLSAWAWWEWLIWSQYFSGQYLSAQEGW